MNNMLILSALASSHGYSIQTFRNFAGSLASTGFDGEIVMMTTEKNYHNHGLRKLEGDYPCLQFKFIPELEDYRNINCYRYGFYHEYLISHAEYYDYVMIADSRDVIFQRDISQYPFDSQYDLFFAEEEKIIKDCGINSGWILDLFGKDVLDEIENRIVLCSGTTIGKYHAILQYLEVMAEAVSKVESEFLARFGSLGGIDQGIHNYIHYKDLLTGLNIKTMHNNQNLIYTVGHVASDSKPRTFLNAESKFINRSGLVCYCVHQYDRLDKEILQSFNHYSNYKL
jgi:hypothetical protein